MFAADQILNIVDISKRRASKTTNRLGSVQERIDKKCPDLDIISGRVIWTLCHCDPALSPHISSPHLMRSCGPQAECSPVQVSPVLWGLRRFLVLG